MASAPGPQATPSPSARVPWLTGSVPRPGSDRSREVMRVRAVMLPAFGPPGNLAVAEVPDPVPGPGQVLVNVHIANITFVETQVRAGTTPNPAMLPQLPAVLGNGVGGVVASAGAGVARRWWAAG